jgi:nucleotide-binding universal stress UspA family protein
VITPDTYFAGSVGLTYGAFPASDIMRDVESSAQNELTTIADPLRAQGLDVSVHAVTGRPIDSILSVQQELGAGWIAMGSHGRTGLGGLVLGGTAHGVLHHASTPVLIVTDATRKLR